MKQDYVVLNTLGYAVRYEHQAKLLDYFPPGHEMRVALAIISITGMRVSELDNVKPSCFWWDKAAGKMHLLWMTRKTRPQLRNEKLPDWFLHELDIFLKQHFHGNGWDGSLFTFTGASLADKLNHQTREALGGIFMAKRPGGRGIVRDEHVVQLKGFRHAFASTIFWTLSKTYGCELAIHMISKRMKHKSTMMTARHYACDVQHMKDELDRWPDKEPGEILGELLGYPADYALKMEEIRHQDIRPFCFALHNLIEHSAGSNFSVNSSPSTSCT